jgi:hypothetical protein
MGLRIDFPRPIDYNRARRFPQPGLGLPMQTPEGILALKPFIPCTRFAPPFSAHPAKRLLCPKEETTMKSN